MKNVSGNMIKRVVCWSDLETEDLITVFKEGLETGRIKKDDGKIDWTIVSDYLCERSGKMRYDRYRYLLKAKDL